MLKRSMMVSAAAMLLLAPALAQSPAPDAGQAKPGFMAEQGKDQWLASKNLLGSTVTGPSNQAVGTIRDLVVDRNGDIIAAVVGVGGFLGIGSKDVAVPFKSLELKREADNSDKISMGFSKDELKQAPDFKPLPAASSHAPVASGPGAAPHGAAPPAAAPQRPASPAPAGSQTR
jgi:PRC-barrel domain